MVIEKITKANDIKKLDDDELYVLAREIRKQILMTVADKGGHLASNLGSVEITMAAHLCLDFPEDKLLFDVGHQSYTHKILTGRKDELSSMGDVLGISGFPRVDESDCDAFDAGHASSSLSAALGMAEAREIKKEKNTIISIIGDGALTGGMVYEALNNASKLNSNLIFILNDNNMSISKNVGGIPNVLANIRSAESYRNIKTEVKKSLNKLPVLGEELTTKISNVKNSIKQLIIPGMVFENMKITYFGPINGHDIQGLKQVITEAKKCNSCVIIHAVTEKGRGYKPARVNPDKYHSVSGLDFEGTAHKQKVETWTEVFSNKLTEIAKTREDVVAVTAAMPDGTGLTKFMEMYPERFFDVGIAEEHAVTFAAGMSRAGLKPVVAIYSTFLQRAYDQVMQDVGLMNNNVLLVLDRAGFVARDGRTHQGIYDLSYLNTVPNLVIAAPRNKKQLEKLVKLGIDYEGPMAIRFPKGKVIDKLYDSNEEVAIGKAEMLLSNPGYSSMKTLLIISVGNMIDVAEELRERLSQYNIAVSIMDPVFVKPVDIDSIIREGANKNLIVSLEENAISGGFGENLLLKLNEYDRHIDFLPIGLEDRIYDKGSTADLRKAGELDTESVMKKILKRLGVE